MNGPSYSLEWYILLYKNNCFDQIRESQPTFSKQHTVSNHLSNEVFIARNVESSRRKTN